MNFKGCVLASVLKKRTGKARVVAREKWGGKRHRAVIFLWRDRHFMFVEEKGVPLSAHVHCLPVRRNQGDWQLEMEV